MNFLKITKIVTYALLIISVSGPIASARNLRISSLELDPFYGSKLNNGGMLTEIVTTAFEKSGHTTTIEFVPWKRAIYWVKKGNTDILMGPYEKTKNDELLYYSSPFYSVYVGLIALKELGLTEYETLSDLKKYSIGINNVFAFGETFSNADYLFKVPFTKVKSNVAKLFKGHVQLIAMPFDVFKSVSRKMKKSETKEAVFVYPPLTRLTLNIAISKKVANYKQVIKDFNRGLNIIKSNGTYSRILKKHGF